MIELLYWLGGLAIGALISYFFYNKSKQKRYLSYTKNSSTLIAKLDDDFYDGINITFCDQKIDKLTSTIFRVWNSGNADIFKQYIAQRDPLKIECKSKILTSRIVKKSEDSFQIATVNDAVNNSIVLDLDFLEKDNGFVCEIIHTGQSSDLNFSGKIIGGSISYVKILYLNDKIKNSLKYVMLVLFAMVVNCITSLLALWNVIPRDIFIDLKFMNGYEKYLSSIILLLLIILCLYIMVFLYRKAFKKIPSSLID